MIDFERNLGGTRSGVCFHRVFAFVSPFFFILEEEEEEEERAFFSVFLDGVFVEDGVILSILE